MDVVESWTALPDIDTAIAVGAVAADAAGDATAARTPAPAVVIAAAIVAATALWCRRIRAFLSANNGKPPGLPWRIKRGPSLSCLDLNARRNAQS